MWSSASWLSPSSHAQWVTSCPHHIVPKLSRAAVFVARGRTALTVKAASGELSRERPSQPSMLSGLLGRKGTPATLLHIAVFSQFGVVARVLLGELFGGNCAERVRGGELSWIPCVVADGTSDNHGGAFFRDLPANAVGCFVMGLLSSVAVLAGRYSTARGAPDKPVAALSANSSLQSHEALQVGLRTGFCGSLTTFASWQLQMMVMLFGGAPTSLDSQWLGVISGLAIGTQVALASLAVGEHAGLAMMGKGMPLKAEAGHTELANMASTGSESTTNRSLAPNGNTEKDWSVISCVAFVVLVASAAVSLTGACLLKGGGFWKKLCVAVLLGPIGAILRWRLGALNGKLRGDLSWFPVGTFAANMLACVVGFLAHAASVYSAPLSSTQAVMVFALKTGFAGSLSTVSTWAVEVRKLMANVGSDYNGYKYILASHLGALLIGVIAYGWAVWL